VPQRRCASRPQANANAPGRSLCRCRLPVVGPIWRRIMKIGRTFCRTAVARVSAGSQQGGGQAWGGGGRRVRPEHTKGPTLIPPSCPWICSFGFPCVLPAVILSFFFFCRKQGNHYRYCCRVPRHSVGIPVHLLYTPACDENKGDGTEAIVGPGEPSWLSPRRGGQPARGLVQAGRRRSG